jgi:hypothetical protein
MTSKTATTKASTANTATRQSVLNYPSAPPPSSAQGANQTEKIRDYLRRLPGYPFDPELDVAYVDELLEDFSDVNILAEIKNFRWYYNNQPFSGSAKPRVALRRWLANAWPAL